MIEAICTAGQHSWWVWAGFIAMVVVFLMVDLFVFHKKSHAVSIKEALIWALVWFTAAMLFNMWIYFECGTTKALEFLTGYLIEKSLSVDNLFIFLVIFTAFSIPKHLQHRILFWGIIGAIIMRGIFIALGTAILEHFIWAFLLFGLVLLYAAYRMQFGQEKKFDPDKSFIVRLFRKVFPVSNKLDGDHFFTLENGKRAATVMLLTLIVIELTDVVFAFDSIPAIFAITTDPFIVFTSNIFAILGLRSLYFVLADIQGMFEYLKSGLAVILLFIAVKLILKPFHFEVPIMISLLVILTILLVSIFASVVHHRKRQRKETEISVEVDLPEFVQESRATHLAHEHAMHRTGSVHPHHARIAHAIPPSRPHPGTARAKPVMEPSTAKKKKRSRSR